MQTYYNISGVYVITNIATNQKYIGSSKDIGRRLNSHKSKLRRNKHHNNFLQNSFNKYGESNFTFELYKECTKSEMRVQEDIAISLEKTMYNENGFNIANVNLEAYTSFNEETKKRISKALTGRLRSEEHCKSLRSGNYESTIYIYNQNGDLVSDNLDLYSLSQKERNTIQRVLRKERKTHNDLIYSFTKLSKKECRNTFQINSKFENVTIIKMDLHDNIISTHNGISEFDKKDISGIRRVLNKGRNSYKGFKYKLLNN